MWMGVLSGRGSFGRFGGESFLFSWVLDFRIPIRRMHCCWFIYCTSLCTFASRDRGVKCRKGKIEQGTRGGKFD
jgi:hypothetical protein